MYKKSDHANLVSPLNFRLIRKKGAQKSIFKKWALPFFFFLERPLKKNGRFSSRPFFFLVRPFFFEGRFSPFFALFSYFWNFWRDGGWFSVFLVGAHQAPIFFSEQAHFFFDGRFFNAPIRRPFFFFALHLNKPSNHMVFVSKASISHEGLDQGPSRQHP